MITQLCVFSLDHCTVALLLFILRMTPVGGTHVSDPQDPAPTFEPAAFPSFPAPSSVQEAQRSQESKHSMRLCCK